MSKKFFIFALLILPVLAMAQASWNGTADTDWYNTSQSTFTLTTSEQLAGLASLVNSGNSFSSKTINLGSDISLSNRAWTPIGNDTRYFNGTFDGKGYVVKNISVENSTSVASYSGLFGRLYTGGTIKNLGVMSSDIKGINYVGGLVAYNQGKVTNCYSRALVKGDRYVGGLVGENGGSISYSYSTGEVVANYDFGGLVGYKSSGSTINSSYYDSGTSGQSDEGKGTPQTTASMKQQGTFSDWNFSTIWGISSSINNGYPHLFGSFVPSSSNSSSLPSSSSGNPEPATIPFTETFENGPNGWVFVNGSQTNKWIIGTATSYDGSFSAYISENNSDNSYSLNSTSNVHIYRDITFPESSSDFVLTFYFKGFGDKSYSVTSNNNTYYDYMRVRHCATSQTPIDGNSFDLGTQLAVGYGNNLDWSLKTIILPAADFSGKTRRLVFSWRNNNDKLGTQPPAAIDNISISEYKPIPATLPFIETFENGQNGWVLVNETGNYDPKNKWMIGTATAHSGSYSAYISDDGLNNHFHLSGASQVTHIYRDITFPVSSSDFTLEYYFKGGGGGSESNRNYMTIKYGTTCTPTAGTSINCGNLEPPYAVSEEPEWVLKTVPLPAAYFSGKTIKLVFSWICSGSTNLNQPPAAIDNICIYASGDNSICKASTLSSNSNTPSSSSGTLLSSSSGVSSSSSSGTTPIRLPQIAGGPLFAYASGNAIILGNLPAGAKVEVFGLSGKRIYSAHPENPLIGGNTPPQISRQTAPSTRGEGVQTIDVQTKGVYFVKVSMGSERKLLRVAVR